MRIYHITFRLLFSLLFLCMPQAYGHMENLQTMVERLGDYLYDYSANNDHHAYSAYNLHTQDLATEEKCYYFSLKAIYEKAMQVYEVPANSSVDKKRSRACLKHLKVRIGNPAWCVLLVSGYVRRRVNATLYLSKDLHCLIEKYVVNRDVYPDPEKYILRFASFSRQWAFITEWLEEGIENEALRRHLGFLEKYATSLYTYGNNFSNERLLQWLIHEKKWLVPTDVQITYIDVTEGYKMKCILFFKEGDTFLYHLQCVHILNKSLMTTLHCEDKKEQMRTMRAEVIAKKPYIFTPLSGLSMTYWTYMKQLYGEPIAGCNVVHDLLYIALVIIFGTPIFLWALFLGYIYCTEAIRAKKADIKSVNNEKKHQT